MKQSNKNFLWLYILLIVIIVGIVVYILYRYLNKKEYYNQNNYAIEKNLENETIEKFLIENFQNDYISNYKIVEANNNGNNPLSNDFNILFHLSHFIKKELTKNDDKILENIREEGEKFALNKKFLERILKDKKTVEKFSEDFFKQLKIEPKIGKIVNNIAYEIVEEVNNKISKKEDKIVENYEIVEKKLIPYKFLYKKINNLDKHINELKKYLSNNLSNLNKLNSNIIRDLAYKAKINNDILYKKILISKNEIELFVNGIKTLENYDPNYYVENYNLWSSIGNFFVHVGNDIHNDIEKTKKWFIHVGDIIKKDTEKVDRWIVHNVDIIGNDIKIDSEKAAKWFVKAYHTIGKWISHEEIIFYNGILHIIKVVSNFDVRAYQEIKKDFKFINIIEKIGEETWNKIINFIVNYIHTKFEDIMHLFSVKHLPNGKTIMTIFYKLIENYLQSILKAWVNDVLPFIGDIIDELFPSLFHILMKLIADIINNFIHINYPTWSLVFCYSFTNCNGPGIENILHSIENYDQEIIKFNNDWKNYVKKCIIKCKNIDYDQEEKNNKDKKEKDDKKKKEEEIENENNIKRKSEIKLLVIKYLKDEFNIKLNNETTKLNKLTDDIINNI